MIKTVIFDFDGVIVDSEQVVKRGWRYASEHMNLGPTDELFLQCVGTNHLYMEQFLKKQFGDDFSYEEMRKYTRKYFREYTETYGLPVKPGVRELMQYLKEQDYQIGLASSSTLGYIVDGLKRADLIDFFKVIVSGETLKRGKPEPDIYLMACEKIGVKPEEAYAIEDSYNGIRSASSAGMKAIMVPDLLKETDEMKRLSTTICEDLFAVKEYLIKNNR